MVAEMPATKVAADKLAVRLQLARLQEDHRYLLRHLRQSKQKRKRNSSNKILGFGVTIRWLLLQKSAELVC